MKANKKDILTALATPARIAGRRSTMPILNNVLLSATGGRLTVSGYDLNQWGESSCPCEGDLEPICILASTFASSVASGPEHQEFVYKDNELECRVGATITIPTLTAAEFPAKPDVSGVAVGVICSELADAINTVSDFVCEDTSRPAMCGVHVKCGGSDVMAEATNGRQFGRAVRKAISGDCDFIVPTAALDILCEALKQPDASLEVSEKRAKVTSANSVIACLLIEGAFPNVDTIVKAPREKIGTLSRDELSDAVTLVRSLRNPKATLVTKLKMDFTEKSLTLETAKSPETPQFKKQIDGKFRKFTVTFDPANLDRCIRSHAAGEDVTVESYQDCGLVISTSGLTTISMGLMVNAKA